MSSTAIVVHDISVAELLHAAIIADVNDINRSAEVIAAEIEVVRTRAQSLRKKVYEMESKQLYKLIGKDDQPYKDIIDYLIRGVGLSRSMSYNVRNAYRVEQYLDDGVGSFPERIIRAALAGSKKTNELNKEQVAARLIELASEALGSQPNESDMKAVTTAFAEAMENNGFVEIGNGVQVNIFKPLTASAMAQVEEQIRTTRQLIATTREEREYIASNLTCEYKYENGELVIRIRCPKEKAEGDIFVSAWRNKQGRIDNK